MISKLKPSIELPL